MLVINIQAINDNKYDSREPQESKTFSPIHKELPLRFPDQDICEIYWEEELNDCTGFPEGDESPTSDDEDMHDRASCEDIK
jgi:hypothetical protein